MTGLACLFGLHSPEQVTYLSYRDGLAVVVVVVRCVRCGIRIAEEVRPVAELQEPEHG